MNTTNSTVFGAVQMKQHTAVPSDILSAVKAVTQFPLDKSNGNVVQLTDHVEGAKLGSYYQYDAATGIWKDLSVGEDLGFTPANVEFTYFQSYDGFTLKHQTLLTMLFNDAVGTPECPWVSTDILLVRNDNCSVLLCHNEVRDRYTASEFQYRDLLVPVYMPIGVFPPPYGHLQLFPDVKIILQSTFANGFTMCQIPPIW